MMKFSFCALVALVVTACVAFPMQAQNGAQGKLRVYFVDVEGGQSTLFVTPAGKSLLIDTGWPDQNFRDADRIAAAAKDAGISRIDYLLITHYHDDHVGGVPQLMERMPVGMVFTHGANSEQEGATKRGYEAFRKVMAQKKPKLVVPQPGDRLPIEGVDATVISS